MLIDNNQTKGTQHKSMEREKTAPPGQLTALQAFNALKNVLTNHPAETTPYQKCLTEILILESLGNLFYYILNGAGKSDIYKYILGE